MAKSSKEIFAAAAAAAREELPKKIAQRDRLSKEIANLEAVAALGDVSPATTSSGGNGSKEPRAKLKPEDAEAVLTDSGALTVTDLAVALEKKHQRKFKPNSIKAMLKRFPQKFSKVEDRKWIAIKSA